MWRGPGRARCAGHDLGNNFDSFDSGGTIQRYRSCRLIFLVRHRLDRSWWPDRIVDGSSWMCVVKVRTNRKLRLKLRFVVLEDLLVYFFPDAFLSLCSFSLSLSLFAGLFGAAPLFPSSGNPVGSNCGPKLSELEG